ncbi:hypothetical protein Taro_001114 [Colocasia esculenta]|uniref:Protein FAM136A n=1 Tax=Colocasia esculenta TaxID=4460 RepID=A0A843TA16_COLES|nr:hypothetical protein [Colocasia esculenta]
MEHIAAAEERIVSDRLRRKLEEVNVAAREQLAPIQDHVNFALQAEGVLILLTLRGEFCDGCLQQAYFKCAYDCFDRRRRQEDINNCVEHCSVPVLNANNLVETEMAKFQERMQRALMVCQDRFEEAKLQKIKTSAMIDLESCVDHAIQDSIQTLPRIVDRLKTSFSLN